MDKREVIARVSRFINTVMVPAQNAFYKHIDMNDEPQRQAFEERKKDLEAVQTALMLVRTMDDTGEVKFSKEFFEMIYRQAMLEYIKRDIPDRKLLKPIFGENAEALENLYIMAVKSRFSKLKDFYKILFNEECKFTLESIMEDL